jgi:hypothetical protein
MQIKRTGSLRPRHLICGALPKVLKKCKVEKMLVIVHKASRASTDIALILYSGTTHRLYF